MPGADRGLGEDGLDAVAGVGLEAVGPVGGGVAPGLAGDLPVGGGGVGGGHGSSWNRCSSRRRQIACQIRQIRVSRVWAPGTSFVAMPEAPLTNAAVEWLRRAYDVLSRVVEVPPEGVASKIDVELTIADDFTWEDRRRFVNYGQGDDPADWFRRIETAWESADQRPHWSISEVIAVRGERIAATTVEVRRADFVTDFITVDLISEDARLRRHVAFDVEDREAAIAEAERLHANDGE